MELIRTVVLEFESRFKDEETLKIWNTFNENDCKAVQIIRDNPILSISALNNKLSSELYRAKPNESNYKRWREYFLKKIHKIVEYCEMPGTEIRNEWIDIEKAVYRLNSLILRALRPAAMENIEQLLNKALNAQHYEAANTICFKITQNFGLYPGDIPIEHYYNKLEVIENICKLERHMNKLHHEVIRLHKKHNGSIPVSIGSEYKQRLQKAKNSLYVESFIFAYKYFHIHLLISNGKDYENTCKNAINYFSNKFKHEPYLNIFRNRLVDHYINEKQYLSAKKLLSEYMPTCKKYTYHWFNYAFTLSRVLLFTNETNAAQNHFNKATKSNAFKSLNKEHKNEWHILGMYIAISNGEPEKQSMRRIKYNAVKVTKDIKLADTIIKLKKGAHNIGRDISILQGLCKSDPRGKEFCNYLKGDKFKPEKEANFRKELVPYERLIQIIEG